MRFFASWWERIPRRHAASLMLAIFAMSAFAPHANTLLKAIVSPTSFAWD